MIAPASKPPVARIADYGKLKYELAKKEKESRKSTKAGTIKEVKLSPKIAQHDFDVRVDKTRELIDKGYKVKIVIMFRGREMAHINLGRRVLDRVLDAVKEVAKAETASKLEGKNLHLMLSPIKKYAENKDQKSSSETV